MVVVVWPIRDVQSCILERHRQASPIHCSAVNCSWRKQMGVISDLHTPLPTIVPFSLKKSIPSSQSPARGGTPVDDFTRNDARLVTPYGSVTIPNTLSVSR